MERKKIIALIKLVEADKPGIIEKCFKEPFLADKHALWLDIIKFCIKEGFTGEKFEKFITICCQSKISNILVAKEAIEAKMYSELMIDKNLSLKEPVPFIKANKGIYVRDKDEIRLNHQQRALFRARYFREKQEEENDICKRK